MSRNVVEQTVEVRNELLDAPVIKEGAKKGQLGSKELTESAPIVMDGPNRGKILNKSFKSLAPDNDYGLEPGTYPWDETTGTILANKPTSPYFDNNAVLRAGQPTTPKVYVENPLGLMEKMNKLQAEVDALKVAKVTPKA